MILNSHLQCQLFCNGNQFLYFLICTLESFLVKMKCEKVINGWIHYSSKPSHRIVKIELNWITKSLINIENFQSQCQLYESLNGVAMAHKSSNDFNNPSAFATLKIPATFIRYVFVTMAFLILIFTMDSSCFPCISILLFVSTAVLAFWYC